MAERLKTALNGRGLLELGIDEHKEGVTVKKRRLFDQALYGVYRRGVLNHNLDTDEVSIDDHPVPG
jgi:hypothetical protein